ncbi:MAG: PEP-CTERM sorting domain-containing protein, partial [Planctomycetota bacterium]
NGLHYEDYVTVRFDLGDGVAFGDVTSAISGGTLGVGIHAQSLPGGTSAAFTTVPEPATLALVALGALLMKHKKRGTAQ